MIQCVIFDMDGTVTDSQGLCVTSFQNAIEDVSGKRVSREDVLATFGPAEDATIAAYASPDRITEGVQRYWHHYEQLHDVLCPSVFEGIPELIANLKAAGIHVAMVTGKGRVSLDISLRKLGLEDTFEAIETGHPERPDKPRGIRDVLAALNISAENAIYVGDTATDVVSARNAGLGTLSAAWADEANVEAQQAEHPVAICKTPAEVWDYVKAQNGIV